MNHLAPVRVTAPSGLPVTIAEARAWLRVNHTSEDATIQTMVEAATAHLDGFSGILGRCILTQQWRVPQIDWTWQIRLPFPNVTAVAVSYFDANNVEQTVSASLYELIEDARSAIVRFGDDFTEPAVYDNRSDGVRVLLTAGYADAASVPAQIKAAIMMIAANWFEDRGAMGSTPAGVKALIADIRRIRI